MKKTARRKHGAFDQAKVSRDIVEVLGDDLRMADNRSRRFITPRIQTGKVVIPFKERKIIRETVQTI